MNINIPSGWSSVSNGGFFNENSFMSPKTDLLKIFHPFLGQYLRSCQWNSRLPPFLCLSFYWTHVPENSRFQPKRIR